MLNEIVWNGNSNLVLDAQFQMLEPNSIGVHPFQVRSNTPTALASGGQQETSADNQLESFHQLKNSIAAKGILQPLLVKLSPTNGRPYLIAGHRRLRAALELGLPLIPCYIQLATTDDSLQAEEGSPAVSEQQEQRLRLEAQIAENRVRTATDPYDEAVALALTKTLADIQIARDYLWQLGDGHGDVALPSDSYLPEGNNANAKRELTNLQRLSLYQSYLSQLIALLTRPEVAVRLPANVVYPEGQSSRDIKAANRLKRAERKRAKLPESDSDNEVESDGEITIITTSPTQPAETIDTAKPAVYRLTDQALTPWHKIEKACGFTHFTRVSLLKLLRLSPVLIAQVREAAQSGLITESSVRNQLQALVLLPMPLQEPVLNLLLLPPVVAAAAIDNSQPNAKKAKARLHPDLVKLLAKTVLLPHLQKLWQASDSDTSTHTDNYQEEGERSSNNNSNSSSNLIITIYAAYTTTTTSTLTATNYNQLNLALLIELAEQELTANPNLSSAEQATNIQHKYLDLCQGQVGQSVGQSNNQENQTMFIPEAFDTTEQQQDATTSSQTTANYDRGAKGDDSTFNQNSTKNKKKQSSSSSNGRGDDDEEYNDEDSEPMLLGHSLSPKIVIPADLALQPATLKMLNRLERADAEKLLDWIMEDAATRENFTGQIAYLLGKNMGIETALAQVQLEDLSDYSPVVVASSPALDTTTNTPTITPSNSTNTRDLETMSADEKGSYIIDLVIAMVEQLSMVNSFVEELSPTGFANDIAEPKGSQLAQALELLCEIAKTTLRL